MEGRVHVWAAGSGRVGCMHGQWADGVHHGWWAGRRAAGVYGQGACVGGVRVWAMGVWEGRVRGQQACMGGGKTPHPCMHPAHHTCSPHTRHAWVVGRVCACIHRWDVGRRMGVEWKQTK